MSSNNGFWKPFVAGTVILTVVTAEIGPYGLYKFHMSHLDPHNHVAEISTESVSSNVAALTTTGGTVTISGDFRWL